MDNLEQTQTINNGGVTAPLQETPDLETLAGKDADAHAALAQQEREIAEATGDTPPEGERPAWLPDKFKSAEELAKSYAELEKKMGERSTAPPPAETETPAEQSTIDKYTQKYMENGELSADDYAELKKAGYDQQIVDGYIAGKKAQAAAYEAEVLSSVDGGKAAYDKMVSWGAENYTDAELEVFNKMVSGGDVTAAKMAVEHLKSRYNAGNPGTPNTVTGMGGASGGGLYTSWDQIIKDMQDPRYRTDPAYQQQVKQKLDNSGQLV